MGVRFEVDLHFDDLREKLTAAMPDAIQKGLEHIAEVSAAQTPLDEGTLVRSQRVVIDEPDSGYISYRTPYAHRQHEELSYRHPHGNAKYLELPMQTETDTALDIIGHELGEHLGE